MSLGVTLHGTLDRIAEVGRGAESTIEHDVVSSEALLGGVPVNHVRRGVTDPDVHTAFARQRLSKTFPRRYATDMRNA